MNNSSTEVFFSIITPNYNSGKKLLRAIKSLQSNSISFEHIIIDDCSTDSSFNVIKEQVSLTNNYNNIIFKQNEVNSGPGYSRNVGLERAKGKYLIFLDSDDYLEKGALDRLYSILAHNEIDILVFNYKIITSNKKQYESSQSDRLYRLEDPLRLFITDKIISAPWGKCIKSDLAKKYKFPNLRVSQDAPYNLDIFSTAKNVYKLDTILYNFDKTTNTSITRQKFTMRELQRFYKSWEYFEKKALSNISLNDIEELIAARKILFCAVYYINRLSIENSVDYDNEMLTFIKNIIQSNIFKAWGNINSKTISLCTAFLISPRSTIFATKQFYKLKN